MMPRKSVFIKSFLLLGLSTLIFLFGLFPALVQRYYSTNIYLYISSTLRFISSIFPFAIGDFIYLLLIAFVLYKIGRFYKNRKQLTRQHRLLVPLQILNFFLILYILFKIIWGLNYSRPGIARALGIGNKKYTVEELVLLGNHFVNQVNLLKQQTNIQGKTPVYTVKILEEKAAEAYALMAEKDAVFKYHNPSVKAVISPWLISKVGIEGYYAPLSGEANINTRMPDFVKPYITCHEIAHQLGIAYEDEANLLGYLTAVNSPDLYFRYAANYEMLRYVLLEIRMKAPDDYQTLYNKILPDVLADFKAERDFWRKYNGQMSGYMGIAFDRFLKLNNQKKGINSYQDIVIWLWNIHQKQLSTTH